MIGVFSVVIALACNTFASGEDELVGHMKPLGHQTPPTVKIDEFTIDNLPTPKEFFDNYMQHSKAAIFRGLIKETTAYKKWTDQYIRDNYPDMEVRLEAKKETYHVTPIGETYIGRDNLRHFVDNYHKDESITYIVSELPKPMYKDVGVPPFLSACGPITKDFVEIDLWWSGGNSVSIIHKDAFNQLNCLVNGTKYWKLFEYKYEKYLHKHWEPAEQVGGFSDVNVEAVNLKQHPNITKVPWSNFTINAGDCLYLPKSYYHQVNSVGTHNLAVSILFERFDNVDSLDFSDCNEKTDFSKFIPLSDIDVDWQWAGNGVMSMGKTGLSHFRRELVKNAELYKENGKKFETGAFRRLFGIDETKAQNMLKMFDENEDGEITVEEFKSAEKDKYRQFAITIEEYEPSNYYDFEYSFISYEKVLALLFAYMERKEILRRDVWVKAYTKKLLGTKTYANRIFTRLAKSEEINEIKRDDITQNDVKYALEKWIEFFAPQYSSVKSVKAANKRYGMSGGKTNQREEESDDDEEEEDGREEGDEEYGGQEEGYGDGEEKYEDGGQGEEENYDMDEGEEEGMPEKVDEATQKLRDETIEILEGNQESYYTKTEL